MDEDVASLLATFGPRLGLRPAGFRRNLGQVRKRVARRMREVGAREVREYAARLEADPAERAAFDGLCRVTISRFLRDRAIFAALEPRLVELARSARPLRLWSAGCASGEEPYSLAALMEFGVRGAVPDAAYEILATDIDPELLERARQGVYRRATLRELPPEWIERGFEGGEPLRVRELLRAHVRFAAQDLRREWPPGPFHVIACRNVAFTYFDEPTQGRVLAELLARLRPEGYLVIGAEESLRLPLTAPA